MSKKLFVFVEGKTDEIYFREAIFDILGNYYENIHINQYSERDKIKLNNKIKGIDTHKNDYIFITDFDNKKCITFRKEDCKKCYAKHIDFSRIYIVKPEIEAWLLAGLNGKAKEDLGITKPFFNTDDFTKEKFKSITPKAFEESEYDFAQEILKYYSIEEAVQKNTSFRYFYEKFLENKVKVS